MCKLTYYLVISAFLCTMGGCSILGHNGLERLDIAKLPKENSPDKQLMISYILLKHEKGTPLRYESKNLVTGESVKIEGNTKEGYRKMEYSNNSDLAVEKYFFPNGSLKSVRQCYIGFPYPTMRIRPIFYMGISQEYNRMGGLIRETEHDENFKFTFDKVKEFLLKRYEIDFSGPGKFAEINRTKSNWVLYIHANYNEKRKNGLRLVLDGNSGEIIAKEEYGIHY